MSQNFTIEMFLAAKYGKDTYNEYTSKHLRDVLWNIDHGLSENDVKGLSRKRVLQALSEHFPINIVLYIRNKFECINKLAGFPQIDDYYDFFYIIFDIFKYVSKDNMLMQIISSYFRKFYGLILKHPNITKLQADKWCLKILKYQKNYLKTIKQNYNTPIGKGVLPNTLTHLTFGIIFNQSIVKGVCGNTLTHLKFWKFNQPIVTGVLPNKLI